MRIVTPLRFVSGVLGLWIAARIAILLPEGGQLPSPVTPAEAGAYRASQPARLRQTDEGRLPAPPTTIGSVEAATGPMRGPSLPYAGHGRATPPREAGKPRGAIAAGLDRSVAFAPAMGAGVPPAAGAAAQHASATAPATDVSPTGLLTPAVSPATRTASRWSGNLYVFRRSDGGTPALATGGQLGGSQAGARVAYRLNGEGPTRLAAAARLSTPLDDRRGAEAAVGLDWHPLPAAPLRLSVERRVDLGGAGRNAWSAYAAGGFWRQRGRLVLDGYAQAGMVGARRADLFADAALRAGHRSELGPRRSLTIGAGAWAAAQPRVERLDLGPRVALGLPVGATTASLAAEWRIRVAGDAAPPSGLAITLAADF